MELSILVTYMPSAFVDAAFADNPGCRSTAGWVYFVQGCVVAYDSHTIKRVVTSSTEAECAALTIIGKENTWQRQMYSDLMGLSTEFPPTPIFGDNTASISMISSGVTKRSRHFSIDWFKFKDLKDQGELEVTWVSTEENLADFFTKKLARQRFCYLRDKIMGPKEKQDYFLSLLPTPTTASLNAYICRMLIVEKEDDTRTQTKRLLL